MTWEHEYTGNKLELFATLFLNKVENMVSGNENARVSFYPNEKDEVSETNNRLNQGWIISRIMQNIPNQTPYLEGETISDAIYSSLFPGF